MTEHDGSSDTPGSAEELGIEEETAATTRSRQNRNSSVQRPYPRRALEQALRVATAIKEHNGGNAWPPAEVATALEISRTSSNFRYLLASSRDFGLTIGVQDSAEVTLTSLGREAVYPRSADEHHAALQKAFFNVDIYRRVVEHYQGSKLPEEPFRTNTLKTSFGLDESIVEEFVDLFDKNCRFAGIGTDFTDSNPIKAAVSIPPVVETVGAKPKPGAPVCFIAMPFSERDENRPIGFFDEVLKSVFEPAIKAAGFEARTAKRQGSDIIQSTIVTELLEADLVLADLTEHNPNVLFELGMRMSADKPVALVRAKGTGPIFDVDHMLRVEDYSPNLWPSTVDRDVARLTAHIKAAWKDKDSTQTFMKILKG